MTEEALARLHQLIDEWAGLPKNTTSITIDNTQSGLVGEASIGAKPPRTDGKRAVRTKDTGDNVYLIDDVAKTKAWVTATRPETGPDTLRKLGFEMSDVVEVDPQSLVGYQMQPSIYRVDG